MGKNTFKGLIFTNHALDRLRERGIKHEQAWETYTYPDSEKRKEKGTTKRRKMFGNYEVSVLFKENENKEIILISCWMEPPLPGSHDARQKEWWNKYKRTSFWGKFRLIMFRQIGWY